MANQKDQNAVPISWLTDLGNDLTGSVSWGLYTIKKPVEGEDALPLTTLRSEAEAARFAATKPDFMEREAALKTWARQLQRLSATEISDAQDAWSTWSGMLIPAKGDVDLAAMLEEVKRVYDSMTAALAKKPEDIKQYLSNVSGDLYNISTNLHPDYLVSASSGGAVIRMEAPEAIRLGSQALLDALTRVANKNIFEQIAMAKKQGGRGNREKKTIFNDPKSYGAQLDKFDGGDDNVVFKAAAQILAYDQRGAMVDATKMVAKCAEALDQNQPLNAARIFGVLIGAKEIPAHENRFGFNFDDGLMKKILRGRCLALTALAALDLRRSMRDRSTKVDSKGEEVKPTMDRVTEQIEALKRNAPKPPEPVSSEAPSES